MSGYIVNTVIGAAGRVNTPPATLNNALVENATSLSPGLTVLPGGLIDDIAGTDTGALVIIDQLVTALVDSLTPYGAGPYILNELGQIYLGQGTAYTAPTNTSVYVTFSGTVGFVIPAGFVVGDGTNQYNVIDAGVVLTGGVSGLVFCQAVLAGSFAVPANTVTTIVTSVPSGVTLTVTNPSAGTAGTAAQTEAQFRAQVLQAGIVTSLGTPAYVKTLLQAVPGVEAQLISFRASGTGWEVIVGGTGDPYAIGNAIFQGMADVNVLVGSTLAVTAITNSNPGTMTVSLNHGYSNAQVINVTGVVGMSGINSTPLTITVVTPTSFTLGINTTSSGTYTSGGVVTPNFRNTSVTLIYTPDSYTVPFVLPPVQTVTMTVTWNTNSLNIVSNTAVATLVQPAIAAYVNAIYVGQPMTLLELNDAFITAVSSILAENLITRLVFTVSINGIVTAPGSGLQTIVGDPESYFLCVASGVSVVKG
jgi:hypothetical protein